MKIIFPPLTSVISEPVKDWKEIKEDALKMVDMIQKDEFGNRIWKQAYAVSHAQVNPKNCGKADPLCPEYCKHRKRFFVVNRKDEYIRREFKWDVIINPVIEYHEEKVSFEEGCMSNMYKGRYKTLRWRMIKVSFWVKGWFGLKKRTRTFSGLAAYVFQHEIEHFDGIY